MQVVRQQNFERSNEIERLIAFHGATKYLNNNKLYKIYLLCPKFSNHIFINQDNLIGFLGSFRDYFNQIIAQQNILFEEDMPHHHHHFSQPDTSLLALLVPPNLIVCMDSMLLLQTDKIIHECILAVYLTPEDEKFISSSHFNMEKIRGWIDEYSDSSSDTNFDLSATANYA
jgi:hypothetical protein